MHLGRTDPSVTALLLLFGSCLWGLGCEGTQREQARPAAASAAVAVDCGALEAKIRRALKSPAMSRCTEDSECVPGAVFYCPFIYTPTRRDAQKKAVALLAPYKRSCRTCLATVPEGKPVAHCAGGRCDVKFVTSVRPQGTTDDELADRSEEREEVINLRRSAAFALKRGDQLRIMQLYQQIARLVPTDKRAVLRWGAAACQLGRKKAAQRAHRRLKGHRYQRTLEKLCSREKVERE